jgi:hypothetical protein
LQKRFTASLREQDPSKIIDGESNAAQCSSE